MTASWINLVSVSVLLVVLAGVLWASFRLGRGAAPSVIAFLICPLVYFLWYWLNNILTWDLLIFVMGKANALAVMLLLLAALEVVSKFIAFNWCQERYSLDPVWVLSFAITAAIVEVFLVYVYSFILLVAFSLDSYFAQLALSEMHEQRAAFLFNQLNTMVSSSSLGLWMLVFVVVMIKVFATLFIYRATSERFYLWLPLAYVAGLIALLPHFAFDLGLATYSETSWVLEAAACAFMVFLWWVLYIDKDVAVKG